MKFKLDPLSPTGLSQVSDVTLVAEGGSSSGGGAVSSVNGQTGVVVLDADDVLPSQAGNNGKFLSTDGTNSSWAALAGGGDMLAATYDPQAIAGDAFARANHTGTQLLATISDVTASAAELNLLDGVTSTTTELNYTDGVTSNIQTQIDGKQPLDSDLTTIAGLTPTTDNFIVSVSSAWASRTPAQVKTTLSLNNVDNTSDATKNAASVTLTNKTLTSPVINTPTGIVKGDVGLGNVDNTSNATERAATRTLTNARITKRSLQSSNDTTFDIDTDAYDYAEDTGLTGAVTVTWSGTPTLGQTLWVSLTGTAARAITWDTDFEASTVALPTTTVSTDRLDVAFVWNAATSKFRCMAVA